MLQNTMINTCRCIKTTNEHFLFGFPGWQGDATVGSFDRNACIDAGLKMVETVTRQELIGFCKEHLASYKAPSAIWYIDRLPRRFELGKVLRFMVRDEYMKKREEIVS